METGDVELERESGELAARVHDLSGVGRDDVQRGKHGERNASVVRRPHCWTM